MTQRAEGPALPCASGSPVNDRAVLLTLSLPRINEYMTSARIEAVHADVGAALGTGSKFIDLTIDLSAIAAQDCPPVSHFRLAVRDRVWLRRLQVARGDTIEVGAMIAWFTTDAHEPLDVAPSRSVRVAIAGILAPAEGWPGESR